MTLVVPQSGGKRRVTLVKPTEEGGDSPDGEEDGGLWFQNTQRLLTALWLLWGDSKTAKAAWAPRKVAP